METREKGHASYNGRTRSIPVKPVPGLPMGMAGRQSIDIAGLGAALEAEVDGEVRFDAASLAMYANDASNFRQVPIGVVVPRSAEAVVTTHRVCSRFGAPIVNRGGGTSLSGETVNIAVVIDTSKYMTEIGDPDSEQRQVSVEPGAINENVNRHTGKWNLVFGPDPSTHSRCTIGGNLGNNSCGVHSVQSQLYGPGPRTSDNVWAMEVVTYDGERFWVGVGEEEHLDEIIAAGGRKGEIYARLRDLRDRYSEHIRKGYPSVEQLPRRVSGYNLDELLPERGFNVARALVGTESTCVTVVRAVLLLTPAMLERTTVVVQYPTIADAAAATPGILADHRPIGLEALDDILIENEQLLGKSQEDLDELPRKGPHAWLLVQFGSDAEDQTNQQVKAFCRWLQTHGYDDDRYVVARSAQEGGNSEDFWQLREGGLGSTAFPPDQQDHWPGWEDSAVPPDRLADYLRDLRGLYDKYRYRGAFYGHFGQGCVHSRLSFDLRRPEGLKNYRHFLDEASDLVISYGGTLSGEHGDGQQRAEMLDKQYGPELMAAMRDFKLIWDPEWKMNPGKVIDPYRTDEFLKLGPEYNPVRPKVKFAYKEDRGDFAHSTLRCVGIGKCRVTEGDQVMCPSYRATREEKHSTRGRARLLFEMLRGEVITDGWRSKEVYEALDLCLACKGCTSECPVTVDIPTYKAEFLYHHYRSPWRWRPRYGYAFGYIDKAARLASRIPELVNAVTHAPLLSRLAQMAAGIDRRREIPAFAPMSLQEWFRRRGGTKNPYGRPVVLFPDTFNNYLHTEVGVACVEAIEAAGWQVIMPAGHLCCGRPLYDYGLLNSAERYLLRVLDALRPYARDGVPVVGMEPSCLAVFKDELTKLLPYDDDAQRLADVAVHFGEFFEKFDVDVPNFTGEVVYWGHCHQRATGGAEPDQQLLGRMGASVEGVKGGCCGLAGSWGFEPGKYDISVACGEEAILPAVRGAAPATAVVSDGFSCKTQIQALTPRRALHVAEVMKLAWQADPDGAAGPRTPEERLGQNRPTPPLIRRALRTAGPLLAGGLVVAAGILGRQKPTGWSVRDIRPRG